MELHDAQTGFRAGTRFGSGRNYRTLKYTREEAEKEAGLETEEIAGYSNDNIRTFPVWKKVKLHGTQALQPLKITNVQVWKKIKLQGSQTCYCAAKTKKLQGTQTFTG